jgi:sulfite reductase (ferredoxin)
MVRVRGAAGIFLPHQVRRVAELSKEFGNGIVHMTTRQDLQIHRVMVQDTPTVLEKLLEAGLSSRGGGGNTVRNISACSLAGVCADEAFDVSPYALALTEYLIRERANFNLPRKFKVAFSGCSKGCSLASVADLGFFAKVKDGVKGFAVFAAGGMGSHSKLAEKINDFIPAESIFETAEAMKRLFDKEGDRTNRNKARLRYVMERLGAEEFSRLYRQELEQVRSEGISYPEININKMKQPECDAGVSAEPEDAAYRLWKSANVIPQKQQGLFAVRLSFPVGEVSSSALSEIAGLAEKLGDGKIRTNLDQELLLQGVKGSALPDLYETLKEMDGRLTAGRPVKTVACAGASTCKLGLGLSRALASAIEAELKDAAPLDGTPIRISGCPNSCGQHPIAPLGLFGSARRINGRLVPYYMVVAGGRRNEDGAALSESLGRVPARLIPALLREFWTEAARVQNDGETLEELIERWGREYLRTLCGKYQHVPPYEEAPEFYRDWGSCHDFTLEGRGD